MEQEPEAEGKGRSKGRLLLTLLVMVPLGAFGVAVAGINLYLLATELVKLFTW